MRIRIEGFRAQVIPGKGVEHWVGYTSNDAVGETGNLSHATWERVRHLIPPKEPTERIAGERFDIMHLVWSAIRPAYEAWLSGQEVPETGTPLIAWHGLSPLQLEALRGVGMRSVEDLAEATEDKMLKAPLPNIRALQAAAKAFLANSDKAAMQAELDRLKQQNEAMLEMLAAREDATGGEGAEPPKRRGRPPKQEAA